MYSLFGWTKFPICIFKLCGTWSIFYDIEIVPARDVLSLDIFYFKPELIAIRIKFTKDRIFYRRYARRFRILRQHQICNLCVIHTLDTGTHFEFIESKFFRHWYPWWSKYWFPFGCQFSCRTIVLCGMYNR